MLLKDRYGNEFPVQNYCKFCYNRIYNCKPLSLLTKKEEVQKIGAGTIRLDFTIENIQEARKRLICVDCHKKNHQIMKYFN